MQIFPSLTAGMRYAQGFLRQYGKVIKVNKWQGIKAPAFMFEANNVYFRACMPQGLVALQQQVQPDLPWSEDHFQERIGGNPLNPGEQYKNWPYYKDVTFNDTNFKGKGIFTHTYMERYWPKHATENESYNPLPPDGHLGRMGVRYEYGDLEDVITLLANDPFTRQAYLPIWFPEDTGVLHGGRVPCTIGYHFMRDGDDLNIHYMIRACDFIRHFRNDVYLTARLAQWVLEKLQKASNSNWVDTQVGILTMDIIHFHVFERERNLV